MKVKRVLRFYFSAESLERAFDNLIIKYACNSAYSYAGYSCADAICKIIGEKKELSTLWGYLDGVIGGLSETERLSLETYAAMRCGIKKLCDDKRKEIKRAAMKFTRRARRLASFENALGLVGKYYCLLY